MTHYNNPYNLLSLFFHVKLCSLVIGVPPCLAIFPQKGYAIMILYIVSIYYYYIYIPVLNLIHYI